jgi:hypothetical protein
MQIKYSSHIETRLALRKIEYDLPKRIYESAEEKFIDTETGHTIAVMRALIYEGVLGVWSTPFTKSASRKKQG